MTGCAFAALSLSMQSPAAAADARLLLADQSDWSGKRGFYLSLENSFTTAPGALSGMILALGVADGSQWRFVVNHPAWQYDRTYTARGRISPAKSELWLDGVSVGSVGGGAVPDGTTRITLNQIPSWAGAATEYFVEQTSVSITEAGSPPLAVSTSAGTSCSMALALLQSPGPSNRPDWAFASGDTFTIDTTFTVVRAAGLAALSPLVDNYGQFRHGDWPEKTRSDADLLSAKNDEEIRNQAWGIPSGYDRYGGDTRATWREPPTGYFRVVKRNGFWWLVSPEGNPCFYRGLSVAPAPTWDMTPVTGRESMFQWLPPRTGAYAGMWGWNPWGEAASFEYVALHSPVLLRKYGAGWRQDYASVTANRADVWGFSGGGKWDEIPGRSATPVLHRNGVPVVARHPDIFDTAVRTQLETVLRNQIAPRLHDPFVVGWTVGSEWDEIVTLDEIRNILALGETVAAKRALVDHGLDTAYGGNVTAMAAAWHAPLPTTASLYATPAQPPDTDIEPLRRFYADRYYACIYQTVKAIDPNHLYLGFYIVPGWWQDEQDWRLIAPWCDVISYDRYAPAFVDAALDALIRESDKPVYCGEFSFPPNYPGTRGYGTYGVSVPDDAAAGEAYRAWMDAATSHPNCVGGAWFQYRDQPVLGRGPGGGADPVYGEHYAFGMVDVADRPKWGLIERVREANLGASRRRLDLTFQARVPVQELGSRKVRPGREERVRPNRIPAPLPGHPNR